MGNTNQFNPLTDPVGIHWSGGLIGTDIRQILYLSMSIMNISQSKNQDYGKDIDLMNCTRKHLCHGNGSLI